ncbi:hypothetical protein ACFYYI_41620 [Streptomyces sp. NPDC002387]|uniref:hypothetical protein n=1 Tax=Streptomyces sp. NPDC002387 TaxID=3364643 RepID=UPI0036A18673
MPMSQFAQVLINTNEAMYPEPRNTTHPITQAAALYSAFFPTGGRRFVVSTQWPSAESGAS